MKNSIVPASVEAERSLLTGQKIIPKSRPVNLPGFDEPLFVIGIQRRGNAEITEELNPKEARINDDSMLDQGDQIEGQQLTGYTTDVLSRGDIVVGQAGRTSGHSGQHMDVDSYCFMEIVSDWFNHTLPAPTRQVSEAILEARRLREGNE